MTRSAFLIAAAVFASARPGDAQRILPTVAAAEAEGVGYRRGPTPTTVSWAFRKPFGGTAQRTCVAVRADGSAAGGSLRSGDFIIRSGLLSWVWPHAEGKYKVLWLPLHSPRDGRGALLLRAVRVGHPAYTLRLRLSGAAAAGAPKTELGFPSVISFPKAGQWVVVATAGDDWGCFVFSISAAQFEGLLTGSPFPTPS